HTRKPNKSSGTTSASGLKTLNWWRPPCFQNTRCVSTGGQPGSEQGSSDTMMVSSSKIEVLARPGPNALLLGGDAGGFLRQAEIDQKTQRLERLVVGVGPLLTGIMAVIIVAHGQQEAGAENVALALALELPTFFAIVQLRPFDAGVAVDIDRSVVLMGVGFGLGRHARERRQHPAVQEFVDVLSTLALGNEAQHDR